MRKLRKAKTGQPDAWRMCLVAGWLHETDDCAGKYADFMQKHRIVYVTRRVREAGSGAIG